MTKRGHDYPGLFYTFEGPEGGGKSVQHRKFVAWLREEGYKVREIREPGGTDIGEQIRATLLNPHNENMNVVTELLLFEAARAQIVAEVIKPSLERGEIVSADRFFDSTLAYQGTAGNIPYDIIAQGNRIATQGIYPDRTIIFDVSPEVSVGRLNPLLDRMESKGRAFHEKVRSGYIGISYIDSDRVRLINTDEQTVDAVHSMVRKDFLKYIGDHYLVDKLART